jgi:hypothetical protein
MSPTTVDRSLRCATLATFGVEGKGPVGLGGAMPEARGWAVVQNGELLVKTVSPTRRAAIVNWLVVEGGLFVQDAWSDAMIETAWEHAHSFKNAELAEVTIRAGVMGGVEEHKLAIKDDAAELRVLREGPVFWLSGESVGGSGWSQTLTRAEAEGLVRLLQQALAAGTG